MVATLERELGTAGSSLRKAAAEAKPQEATPYREAPYNLDLEQMVLGAILTDNAALNQIGDFLLPDHFYEPVHQRMFAAIIDFSERGLIANPVTLKNSFEKDPALEAAGGAAYLVRVAGMASTIINIKEFAQMLYNLAVSRELIHIGSEIVNQAYETKGDAPASEQIEVAEQQLFNLASTGSSDKYFVPINISLTQAIETANLAAKRGDAISGVPTGFKDLDSFLGGLQKSDLVILAARPSMGKTALALNLAVNGCRRLHEEFVQSGAAISQKPCVGFFSLEMSSEQLATRLLSMDTGIGSNKIRRGDLKKGEHSDEFEKLVRASQELYKLPLFIDDTPALSISAVRTRARRLKRKHNLAMLVVDYLQLLRGTSAMSQQNRVQEVSEITQGLKAIAKELDIPVLALSQLSRQVEQRDEKRPQLSDLRESGSIEQDADVVMFLYRAAYYKAREKPQEGSEKFTAWQQEMEKINNLAEVIVSKHRNGPIGSVDLYFDGMTTKFSDLMKDDYTPPYHG